MDEQITRNTNHTRALIHNTPYKKEDKKSSFKHFLVELLRVLGLLRNGKGIKMSYRLEAQVTGSLSLYIWKVSS